MARKMITCCKECVPPKRYTGCHDKCKEYIEQRADWEERKERMRIDMTKSPNITSYDFYKIAFTSYDLNKRARKNSKSKK